MVLLPQEGLSVTRPGGGEEVRGEGWLTIRILQFLSIIIGIIELIAHHTFPLFPSFSREF